MDNFHKKDLKLFRYSEARWSMPFLFTKNHFFVEIMYKLLGKNHNIDYVYGAPACAWNGGRVTDYKIANLDFIEKELEKIASFYMTPTFTFNNSSITMDDLQDEYCNKLLKIISKTNSEVIIMSELLFKYIKDKYSNIKICASVIKSTYQDVKKIDETNYINSLTKKYDRVVIRPEYVIYNYNNLSAINDKSKIEILVNQHCARNCSKSMIDYKLIELHNKGIITREQLYNTSRKICPISRNNKVLTNCLNEKEIKCCLNAGISQFKLQGRNLASETVLSELMKYFFSENIDKKLLLDILQNTVKSDYDNFVLN